jgi:hypothetical protein
VPVTRIQVTPKVPIFTNVESANMKFIYSFGAGNFLTALNIDIRIGGNLTDVYLKECVVIWKKQALSWSRGRRNMWVQENVLDRPTVSKSTRHSSFSTGRLSQRAAWRAVCDSGLYPFQLQVQGLQQGTNVSVYSLLDGCNARLCTTLNICTVVRHDR